MRVKLFNFRYSSTLGGFDEEPLREFMHDKEVLQFREHFFVLNDVPHLACVVTYQEPLIDPATREAAREIAMQPGPPGRAGRWRGSGPPGDLSERDRALWASLREWRSDTAREDGVPPYVVLTNRELTAIVVRKPDSLTAMGNIRGIGGEKVKRYGKAILQVVLGPAAEAEVAPAPRTSDPTAPGEGTT